MKQQEEKLVRCPNAKTSCVYKERLCLHREPHKHRGISCNFMGGKICVSCIPVEQWEFERPAQCGVSPCYTICSDAQVEKCQKGNPFNPEGVQEKREIFEFDGINPIKIDVSNIAKAGDSVCIKIERVNGVKIKLVKQPGQEKCGLCKDKGYSGYGVIIPCMHCKPSAYVFYVEKYGKITDEIRKEHIDKIVSKDK